MLTTTELLVAAEAADVWPACHGNTWEIDLDGKHFL